VEYIHITFSQTNLQYMAAMLDRESVWYKEDILFAFPLFVSFEKEADAAATRFTITANLETLHKTGDIDGFIWLLDFIFPEVGMTEYFRRIFHQYDMALLEGILFYLNDYQYQFHSQWNWYKQASKY